MRDFRLPKLKNIPKAPKMKRPKTDWEEKFKDELGIDLIGGLLDGDYAVNLLLTVIHNEGFKVIYSKLDNRFHLEIIDTKLLNSDVHCKTCNDIRTIQKKRK